MGFDEPVKWMLFHKKKIRHGLLYKVCFLTLTVKESKE